MQKTPRPYQDAAIKAVFHWFAVGNQGHPLIVAPVGSGKSLIAAEFIKRIQDSAPRTKIVVLTHVQELLVQNADELRTHYPSCDFGFYCAGLNEKKLHNDVTFASIQSVYSKAYDFPRAVQIIICDECHLIPHKSDTQYRKFIDDCIAINPNCKVIGLTGTPFRSDSGRLDDGDNKLFDGIAYDIGIDFMIKNGFLCKPVVPQVNTVMSVDGVKTRNGDYIESQLQKAVDVDDITRACVDEIIDHGRNRKKWLIFTAGVQHCEHVRDEIRSRGVSCEMVTGETPKGEREDIIRRYRSGDIQCLVNVAVLTTGFNVPEIDMLAFMRPTRSPVLYIQCIGRGLRIAPGKMDCLVLDFGGVVKNLGPIDAINITKKHIEKNEAEKKLQAVMKICPSCGAECAAAQKYCYICSHCFVSTSLDVKASNKAILTEDEPPEWYEVVHVSYNKHIKKNAPDAPPTLRVTYTTMTSEVSEWICFEHEAGSFANNKAIDWHFERSQEPCPDTIDDALKIAYKNPSKVLLKRKGRFYEVVKCDMTQLDEYADCEEIAF